VATQGKFAAFCPYASRLPFEIWIAPTLHQSSFGQIDDYDLGDLGILLQRILQALRSAAGDPDFNLVVASAPADDEKKRVFLWHVKVLPRMATRAGFELGSGMDINTVAPEDASESLRQAITQPAVAGA